MCICQGKGQKNYSLEIFRCRRIFQVDRIKNFNIDFIYETTFAKTFNFREQAVDVVEDKQYLFHIKFSKESDYCIIKHFEYRGC